MSRRCLVFVALAASLSGCWGGGQFDDLDRFMSEVRARPLGSIEPLPTFRAYEAFTYNATTLRSPFQPPVKIDVTSRQRGSHLVHPDEARTKQFLEGFNVESFEMVGTLSNGSGIFGLLRGATGVYRVKVGDYVGRNDGRITAVGDARIDLMEIIPDGEGAWLERPRTIALKERQ